MAFGIGKQETQNQAAQMAQEAGSNPDFLNEFAGDGTNIASSAMAASYLSITNAMSDAVKNGLAEEGVFFNSGNQKSYGTELRVIPVAFKLVWDEKDQAGKTVGRYEPQSIPVQEVPPPPGKTGYPKLINPATGNSILETFAYALVLVDDPQAGYVFITAGAGSMKAFRKWNSLWANQYLPNKQKAPMYAKIWRLISGSKISTVTHKPFFALDTVIDEGWVSKDLFETAILPARQASTKLLIEATAQDSDQGSGE